MCGSTLKKPSKEVKEILKSVGQVQNLIGRALANHHDDRNPNRHAATTDALEKAFEACLDITGKYPPQDAPQV